MPAYKLDNGKWSASFYYHLPDGTLKQKFKRSFETEDDALRYENKFRARAENPCSFPFAAFVDVYLADMKPRIRWTTYDTKRLSIGKWIKPYFGEKLMGDIKPIDILHWQGWLGDQRLKNGNPLSPTYVRKLNSDLASLFNHAERNYGLKPNPMKKIPKSGKTRSSEIQIWSKEEFNRFLDAICDKAKSYYAFDLLFWTGIREGELLALTPADFDFENRILTIDKSLARKDGEAIVGPPKTKKSYRKIALSEFLCEEIREYIDLILKIGPTERIFEGMTKSFLCNEMDRGCRISGVKRIRVHDLRHSHVSMLIHMGFSVVAIAERMGHETTDITFRYAHLLPNSQGVMANALNEAKSIKKVG